jgi:hypothetical protein
MPAEALLTTDVKATEQLLKEVYPEKHNYLASNSPTALGELWGNAQQLTAQLALPREFISVSLLLQVLLGHKFQHDLRYQSFYAALQMMTDTAEKKPVTFYLQQLQQKLTDYKRVL